MVRVILQRELEILPNGELMFTRQIIKSEIDRRRLRAAWTIQLDGGGYHVLWYHDDDENSGYGEGAEIARWYGSREACERRASERPPTTGWGPVGEGAETDPRPE